MCVCVGGWGGGEELHGSKVWRAAVTAENKQQSRKASYRPVQPRPAAVVVKSLQQRRGKIKHEFLNTMTRDPIIVPSI